MSENEQNSINIKNNNKMRRKRGWMIEFVKPQKMEIIKLEKKEREKEKEKGCWE